MIVLGNDDILKLADPYRLIAEMERAFAQPGDMPERLHYDLPGTDNSKLLVMPAWRMREAIGVKVATVMPGNNRRGLPTIDGLYVLLDGATGHPRAVMSAPALTAVRTAAVSGLAARNLAREDAEVLFVIGTGALAPHLIRAHAAVRSYKRILLWGRSAAKAAAVAKQVEDMACSIEIIAEPAAGVAQADVISSATSASAPLIRGALLKPGVHVDLVGSFAPDMREADSMTFERGRLIVDARNAFDESGDLIAPVKEGILSAQATPTLHDLVCDPALRRRDEREITIFKSVGTGLSDIAAAQSLYDLHIGAYRDGAVLRPPLARPPRGPLTI